MVWSTARRLSLIVPLAILLYAATFSQARAVEVNQRFLNPGTIPIDRIEICSAQAGGAQVCVTLPTNCAGGAECSVKIDLPHGRSILSARASAAGSAWSAASATLSKIAIDPALCYADDACALDRDHDGKVAGNDFAWWPRVFGTSWLK